MVAIFVISKASVKALEGFLVKIFVSGTQIQRFAFLSILQRLVHSSCKTIVAQHNNPYEQLLFKKKDCRSSDNRVTTFSGIASHSVSH